MRKRLMKPAERKEMPTRGELIRGVRMNPIMVLLLRLPIWQIPPTGSPSIEDDSRAPMVCSIGRVHATTWYHCACLDMDSCAHLSPADRNHVKVSTTHHAPEAM